MYGSAASQRLYGEKMLGNYCNDTAAIANPWSPVCFDVAKIAAGTTGRGETISNDQAVGSFMALPSTANGIGFLGVCEKALDISSWGRVVMGGPTKVRVYNALGASLALAVGDPLVLSPGNDYLVPLTHPISAGTSRTVSKHAGRPVAIVRKAITIATVTTSLVEVWIYPCSRPVVQSYTHVTPGAAPATITACPWFVARGPGLIVRAGMGVATGGNAGKLDLDVLITAVSIFTTKPVIDEDCIDPCHTLSNVDAPAAGAGPGTEGVYGTVNTAANILADRDKVTFTLTNTSSFVGTHLHLQADVLYF